MTRRTAMRAVSAKIGIAALMIAGLSACGETDGDTSSDLKAESVKAAKGGDVEFDLVDEKADNLTKKEQDDLDAWEKRMNEDINKNLDEMRKDKK